MLACRRASTAAAQRASLRRLPTYLKRGKSGRIELLEESQVVLILRAQLVPRLEQSFAPSLTRRGWRLR